jgi:hypothetical protein
MNTTATGTVVEKVERYRFMCACIQAINPNDPIPLSFGMVVAH